MSLLFTLELFIILWILVILPDDIGEGDKTCWIIDHNQEDVNSPIPSKRIKMAFMNLHDTAMKELCKQKKYIIKQVVLLQSQAQKN